jgi:hypothetical protein
VAVISIPKIVSYGESKVVMVVTRPEGFVRVIEAGGRLVV